MVNFPVRNSRRRRVLNDRSPTTSVTSTSYGNPTCSAGDDESEPAPRYSEAAGVEHHPQITDFIPRRYRSIVTLIGLGGVSSATLAALDHLAPLFGGTLGEADFPTLVTTAGEHLGRWLAAVVLLVASALCLIIFSLRRHRIDDFRGRYRVWLAASAVTLALSANSVAALHHVVAQILVGLTGWTALRDSAAWWLAVFSLPVTWVVVRTLLDVKECRLAGALLAGSVGCYTVSAASYLRLAPAWEPSMGADIYFPLMLMGHWLLLASVVTYARFVVLDVQGLIPVRQTSRISRSERQEHPEIQDDSKKTSKSPKPAAASDTRSKTVPTTANEVEWIDGSRAEHDHYEDEYNDDASTDPHKLSKSERKRLRKLKAQRRAA